MRPTHIQGCIMKKILTFAVMAFLLGAFTVNVNAQDKTSKPKNQAKTEVQQTEDWNKVISEFESAVDKCVTAYQKMQKSGGKDASAVKEFNSTLDRVEKIKTKIEKAKNQLDRTQVNRYNKACQKLAQVYAKG